MKNWLRRVVSWKVPLFLFAICIVASFVLCWLVHNLFTVSAERAILITAGATLVVAFATIFLVFITNKVVSATRDTIHGQILLQISRDYASDDMLKAIKYLREWKKEHGKDFVKKFLEKSSKDIDWEYDKYRRRVSHHFYQIYLLWESDVIDDKFLTTLVKQGKLDFLLEVIKPLDLEIADSLAEKKLDEIKISFLKKTYQFFEQTQNRLTLS